MNALDAALQHYMRAIAPHLYPFYNGTSAPSVRRVTDLTSHGGTGYLKTWGSTDKNKRRHGRLACL